MNVVGITGTISKTKHFWEIAAPMTGATMKFCAFVVRCGEIIWFAIDDLLRFVRKMIAS